MSALVVRYAVPAVGYVSLAPGNAYYLRINVMAATLLDLDALAQSIGLSRDLGEDSDDLASRCHYRIDDLMRERAYRARDHRLNKRVREGGGACIREMGWVTDAWSI